MATEAKNSIDQRRAIPQDSRCRAVFSLEGMTCASCAMRIEKGLKRVLGVADAQVNLATELATVTYDPAQTGPEQMVQKVEAVGYRATPLEIPTPVEEESPNKEHMTLALEGMTCASCAMRIEKGLKKVPGVIDAQVNLATERATVTYDPEQTGVEQMVQKVEAVGYQAMPLDQPAPRPVVASSTVGSAAPLPSVTAQQEDERSTRKQAEILHKRNILILGIILSLPIIVLTMFLMNRFPGEDYLLFALTTPSGPSWAGISTGERSRRCVMVARIWIP